MNFKKILLFALLLSLLTPINARAASPETVSFADALKMAAHKLPSLEELDDNIKDLKDQKKSVPALQARALERQIDSLNLSKTMQLGSMEMSLMNLLVNIHNSALDIALMEETVRLNAENARRTEFKVRYGMASESDLRAAEQQLAQNISNLDSLRLALENERLSLRSHLQLPLTQDVTVDYERVLTDMPEDLDTYIARALAADPGIKQKQLIVDQKKSDRDNNSDPGARDDLKDAYDKAVRERDDAKKALEAAIRSNFNSLEQLFARAESLRLDLDKARDNLRAAEARLAAGMITAYDVEQAMLSILNNEVAIEKNINQIWVLQFALLHPYLLRV